MAPDASPLVVAPDTGRAHRLFSGPTWHGVATVRLAPERVAAEAARLADPACAKRTLHWGRNYIYEAVLELADGPTPVAVKQFRHDGWKARLDRRLKGTKAARSFRAAAALAAAGVPTPEPLLLIESVRAAGPAYFVSRLAEGGFEARFYFRALLAGREAEEFPALEPEALIDAVARLLRGLHAIPCWHRDVSIGNLLVTPGATPASEPRLVLLDLNRAQIGKALSASQRTRDLCRLPILRADLQERLLRAYWGDQLTPALAALYRSYQRSFLERHRWKPALRAVGTKLRGLVAARGAHPHIPPPPPGAKVEDRAVWDALSDQPHLHAGRSGRAAVRLRAAPLHLRALAVAAGGLLRARGRYRKLMSEAFAHPASLDGFGVALRPWPQDPDALLAAIDELGVRRALLRLHPWQERHQEEEELARALAARGIELAFALPQTRELVRNRARWRAAVAELAERFAPYGRHFQLGQAINRSKWGVWTPDEFVAMAAEAAEILRRRSEVEILGPAVIDFEPHALAAVLGLPGPDLRFDVLSTLLYVDRRGAPENRQLGFDTVGKLALLRAIAASSPRCADRLWVTEVNWPLREGPHSPAGKAVSVDEAAQADYLVRYALLALGSGLAERVYWWQLVAKGYGLIDPLPDGRLRRRPAFHACRALLAASAGATCVGRLPAPAGTWLLDLRAPDGRRTVAGWSASRGESAVAAASIASALPGPVAAVERLGATVGIEVASNAVLDGTVQLFRLQD